jgi:hypothetical protein
MSTRGLPIMSGNDVGFATDNDPYLQYKRKLGSGGFGTVHEVLPLVFSEADEDLRYSRAQGSKATHSRS